MNVNFSEIVVIFLVALVLFGPDQLPQMARQLGKLAAEFRKGSQAIRREWYNAVYPPAQEVRRDLTAHADDLRNLKAQVLAPPQGSVPSSKNGSQADKPTEAGEPQAKTSPGAPS